MFKNVEDDKDITGYYFQDKYGVKWQARIPRKEIEFGESVRFGCENNLDYTILKEDIPRLIKVLQAAYEHKGD